MARQMLLTIESAGEPFDLKITDMETGAMLPAADITIKAMSKDSFQPQITVTALAGINMKGVIGLVESLLAIPCPNPKCELHVPRVLPMPISTNYGNDVDLQSHRVLRSAMELVNVFHDSELLDAPLDGDHQRAVRIAVMALTRDLNDLGFYPKGSVAHYRHPDCRVTCERQEIQGYARRDCLVNGCIIGRMERAQNRVGITPPQVFDPPEELIAYHEGEMEADGHA